MRVVADTNIVISGLLWRGPPRQLLNEARAGVIVLFTTLSLLAELEDVPKREKFAERLGLAGVTVRQLVLGYAALAVVVEPVAVERIVAQDPKDDEVLSCALAAKAEAIASGDRHLLKIGEHGGIPILTANELLNRLAAYDS